RHPSPPLFPYTTLFRSPTRADARAAGTTARRLAFRWAMTLRQTLALPPLTLSARLLLVPFGESRALRVGGVAAGPLELSPRDPQDRKSTRLNSSHVAIS